MVFTGSMEEGSFQIIEINVITETPGRDVLKFRIWRCTDCFTIAIDVGVCMRESEVGNETMGDDFIGKGMN